MGKETKPEPSDDPADEPQTRDDDAEIRCRACEEVVTRASLRTERHGKHEHAFLNPGGVPYRIALYVDAPGCVPHGEMESYFTWFPGHAWRVALCRRCQTHLGWSFHGATTFHGLIVERVK